MKKRGIIPGIILAIVFGCDLTVLRSSKEPAAEQEVQETKEDNAFEEIDRQIRAGKTEEALRLLEREDRTSAEYYYLKEIACLEDGSEKANKILAKMYPEAADQWPEWQHMQKMAGAAALYEGNYASAEYRLLEALRLDTEDAETWYYLGALSYYEGNDEDMEMYFEYALERGLSETKQQQILWYAEQAGDRQGR